MAGVRTWMNEMRPLCTRHLTDVLSFHIHISPIKYRSHFPGEKIGSEGVSSLLEITQLLGHSLGTWLQSLFHSVGQEHCYTKFKGFWWKQPVPSLHGSLHGWAPKGFISRLLVYIFSRLCAGQYCSCKPYVAIKIKINWNKQLSSPVTRLQNYLPKLRFVFPMRS